MGVMVVSEERGEPGGCMDGGRAGTPVRVPVLAHVRVSVHVVAPVPKKSAD